MKKITYAHITYKILRPKNEEQELKLQMKILKTVSEVFGDNRIPFANPKIAHKSGTMTMLDEDDLLVFTIHVYISLDSKTKSEIEELAHLCNNKLKNLRNAKQVICYNSI